MFFHSFAVVCNESQTYFTWEMFAVYFIAYKTLMLFDITVAALFAYFIYYSSAAYRFNYKMDLNLSLPWILIKLILWFFALIATGLWLCK